MPSPPMREALTQAAVHPWSTLSGGSRASGPAEDLGPYRPDGQRQNGTTSRVRPTPSVIRVQAKSAGAALPAQPSRLAWGLTFQEGLRSLPAPAACAQACAHDARPPRLRERDALTAFHSGAAAS